MMLLPSRWNIALARAAYLAVSGARRLAGHGDEARVSRGGLEWVLDLREGLDLTIYVTGHFQRGVVDACRRLLPPGGVAMDIGANMGAQTLHLAAAAGPHGRVVAVEPTAYPLARLRRNLAANPALGPRVTTLQAFLVAGDGESIPEALPSSWRVAGDRTGAHPVHLGVPQATEGAVALTLDALVAREDLGRLDLVKLDVDGAEDDVLAGGETTLRRFRPAVVMEVAPYTLTDRGQAGDAPLRRLQHLGYRFTDLKGVSLGNDLAWVATLGRGFGRDIVALPDQAESGR
jgi:FkbM family methyltransferase